MTGYIWRSGDYHSSDPKNSQSQIPHSYELKVQLIRGTTFSGICNAEMRVDGTVTTMIEAKQSPVT